MCAIGHSSTGGVGQEELQASNQLPGDTHFNGAGLAQHRDCVKRDSVRTGNLARGKAKEASMGMLSPPCNLHS